MTSQLNALDAAEELLLRRARELAAAPDPDGVRPATLELLTFTAAGRLLALETRRVQRILRHASMCRLPLLGGHLLGLVDSLGEAVPVADLGALLDGRPPQPGGGFVVVLDGVAPPVGLLVDEVVAVTEVPADTLHAAPSSGEAPALERAVTTAGAVLLDADLLLADPRLTLPSTPGAPCPT